MFKIEFCFIAYLFFSVFQFQTTNLPDWAHDTRLRHYVRYRTCVKFIIYASTKNMLGYYVRFMLRVKVIMYDICFVLKILCTVHAACWRYYVGFMLRVEDIMYDTCYVLKIVCRVHATCWRYYVRYMLRVKYIM